MDRMQSKPSTSKMNLATLRAQVPRRSSSVDARPSMGPLSARSGRTSPRSGTPAAAAIAGSRRSSSLTCLDGRPSQNAQRPASVKDTPPFTDKECLAESVEKLFLTDAPPMGSPGFQMAGSNFGILLRYCLESKEGDDDKFLDRLVLDTFGPIEPVEETEGRLAEQEAELQRLTALAEEEEALEAHLEHAKMKVKNFETYFAEMEQHFEMGRAEVEANEEAIKQINGQKEELREQLARQQALLREQCGRQEDQRSLQQKEQRQQQSLLALRSEVEALREQQRLLGLSWDTHNEEIRAANAKLQQSFASVAGALHRVLPHSVLEDFDLRPVEDARSLERHQACNRAALARASGVLEQAKQDLEASTRQEEELCEHYSFAIQDLQRQLELKKELILQRESYFTAQAADKRKRAQELDEEYAELSKRYADLELKTMSASDEQAKAVADAKKRLADAQERLAHAQERLAHAVAISKDTTAASDDERWKGSRQ
ncbi:uncharacterized protein LOC144138484 [Haemaphysalis longicornis]